MTVTKDCRLVNAQPSQHDRKLNLQLQVTITTDLKLERFSELYLLIRRFNHTTGILLYSFSHMIRQEYQLSQVRL